MTEPTHEKRNLPVPIPPRARKESLAGRIRSVVVTGAISAALLSTMYGVTLHRAAVDAAQHQAEMLREASLPKIFQ